MKRYFKIFKESSYKMYWREQYIADYVELDTDFGLELEIRIKDTCDLSLFEFMDLYVLQENRLITDEGVRIWIDERCVPETQTGVERKLKLWGLKSYDQVDIMHTSSAINMMDDYWIAFDPSATFNENHPNGDNFKRILGDPEYRKRCTRR